MKESSSIHEEYVSHLSKKEQKKARRRLIDIRRKLIRHKGEEILVQTYKVIPRADNNKFLDQEHSVTLSTIDDHNFSALSDGGENKIGIITGLIATSRATFMGRTTNTRNSFFEIPDTSLALAIGKEEVEEWRNRNELNRLVYVRLKAELK